MLDVPATHEGVELDALELAVGFEDLRRSVFAEAMQLRQHRDKVCIGIYEPLRDGFQVSGRVVHEQRH